MYIWEITCYVRWTYHSNDEEAEDDGADSFALAASDYEMALAKLKKVALAKSRGFKDDNDPDSITFGKMMYPVKIVDIIKIERKDWIDG